MRFHVLVHSSTGNTALLAELAQRHLEHNGHKVSRQNIQTHPDLTTLEFDVLVVASPTMYFRGSFAMERFLRRMQASPSERPAILLATAAGETGAHFPIQGELLGRKGYFVVGAHWVISPSNYPLQRAAVALGQPLVDRGKGLADLLKARVRQVRLLTSTFFDDHGEPDLDDLREVASFLDGVLASLPRASRDLAVHPSKLRSNRWGTVTLGRLLTQERVSHIGLRVDGDRCVACGMCASVCPVEAVVLEKGAMKPVFGSGCTGCYACFNHCPSGAISVTGAPRGLGRYRGPSRAMRERYVAFWSRGE